jgi:cystathionine beta-lyase family protein involved in aluminum resistance
MPDIYNLFNIDDELKEVAIKAEEMCREKFLEVDKTAEYNGAKILNAFINNKISEACLHSTTGYGYDDIGRDSLDKVYADAFGAEDALVRANFISGTHALSTALFGVLRTGDTMVSITGKPYDTLEEVIGISGKEGNGSLKDYKIDYKQVDLLENGKPDIKKIKETVKGTKLAYIQRSRGYSLRPAFTISDIEEMALAVKSVSPETIVMVDNCYGEFIEEREPVEVGADLQIGSLIKNPGGSIAQTGGYIAGKADLVELCSYRLTSVGMGKEVGCTMGQNRELYLGFFHAPTVVAAAVKTSLFASCFFNILGYKASPSLDDKRGDIITAIELGSEDKLTAFCEGIQKGSPIDSYVTPEGWDMPGYQSKVIMAAGTFTMGASIELSADAPLREPYAVWMQGGITYPSSKAGVLLAAKRMKEKGIL